jgi:AcrR family transcriptional regulator
MAIPDQEVRDPRIKRTRRLLQDALRAILRNKPFDDILVQDITNAATVNRATFYDHYKDKFDLFNALIGADFDGLLEARNVCLDGSCTSGLGAIVYAVSDFLRQVHRDQAACSRQVSSGSLMDAAITLAIRRIVLEGLEKQSAKFDVPREVIAAAVSGAVYNAVREAFFRTKEGLGEPDVVSIVKLILPLLEGQAATSSRQVSG